MVRQTSKNSSPYSKMYLVTPMVYEKLKQCLSKVDKLDLGNLNKKYIPKVNVDKSDKIIRHITNSEIRPDSDDDNENKKKYLIPKYKSENLGEGTSTQRQPEQTVEQFDLSQNYMDDFGESEMYLNEEEIEPIDESFEFGDPIQQPIKVFQDFGTQTDPSLHRKKIPMMALQRQLGRSIVEHEDIAPSQSFQKPKTHNIGIQSERIEEIPRGFKPTVNTKDTITQTDRSDLIYKQPVLSIRDQKKHQMIENLLKESKKKTSTYPISKTKPRKLVRIKLRGNQNLLTPRPRPSTSHSNWVEFNETPSIPTSSKKALAFHGIAGKKDTMKFQCDVCQKWFSRKYGVDRHKRTFHANRGVPYIRRNTNHGAITHEPTSVEAITYQPEARQALTYQPKKVKAITYQPKKLKALTHDQNELEMQAVEPYGSTEDLSLRVQDEINLEPGTSMDHSDKSLATKRGRKYQLVRPRKKVITKDQVYDKKNDQDRFESWDI